MRTIPIGVVTGKGLIEQGAFRGIMNSPHSRLKKAYISRGNQIQKQAYAACLFWCIEIKAEV
jgi:hypothetical protein